MDWLNNIPRIPIGDAIDYAITLFSDNFSFLTKAFSDVVESGIAILIQGLMFFPPWVLILAFTALAWFLSRKRSVMLLTLIGLFLIWNMKLWGPMVSTLALVLVSTVIAMITNTVTTTKAARRTGAAVVAATTISTASVPRSSPWATSFRSPCAARTARR